MTLINVSKRSASTLFSYFGYLVLILIKKSYFLQFFLFIFFFFLQVMVETALTLTCATRPLVNKTAILFSMDIRAVATMVTQ